MRLLGSNKKENLEELTKDEAAKALLFQTVLDLSDSTEIPRAQNPQSVGASKTKGIRQQFNVQQVEIGIVGGKLQSM
jgi:hypothetical protein